MKYQSLIVESNSNSKDEIIKKISDFYSIKIDNLNIKIIEKALNKQSIGIKEVSEISEFLFKKDNNPKIVLINNANLLTTEAQNSILKIVEEPPENSIVCFVCKNHNYLLATIISRCLLIVDSNNKTNSNEIENLAKSFINSSKLEKYKIVDQIILSEIDRDQINQFLEQVIIEASLKKIYIDLSNIKKIKYLTLNSGNLRIILDNLANIII